MANLQRLPGATAHMKLLPGQHEESDIQIARSGEKWQRRGLTTPAASQRTLRPAGPLSL